jgi:hypothetical protein
MYGVFFHLSLSFMDVNELKAITPEMDSDQTAMGLPLIIYLHFFS